MRFDKFINERKLFTKDDEKTIYNILKGFFNLPTKRFTGRGIDMNVDGAEIRINSNMGILVIDSENRIRNLAKLANKLKEFFGDVYVKGNYINARDFGKKYEEIVDIKLPTSIKPIVKISEKDIKDVKTTSDAGKLINKIKKSVDSRKVILKLKNIDLKVDVLKKGIGGSIIKYDGNIFARSLFDLYYAKDVKEAAEILRLLDLESNIYRSLEVASWDDSI